MNKLLFLALAAAVCVALLAKPSEAGRRRNGGGRSSERFVSRFFGNADWFEAPADGSCDNPPNDDDGDNGDDDVGDGGTEVFDTDGNDEVPEIDPNSPQRTSEKLFSLSGVDVCQGASEGEEKCICVRGRVRRFFGRGYRLRCGTCQMQFVQDRSNNGGNSGNVRRFGTLVSLKDDKEEDEMEDFFSRR